MSDNLRGVVGFSPGDGDRWWSSSDLGLGYRTSAMKRDRKGSFLSTVILSATFALRSGNARELEAKAAEYQRRRAMSQPRGLCAGSVFKRTEQYPAGFLIDNAGLKGARIGGAIVSPKHANFIVNLGNATASHVKALIERIQETVQQEFKVALELEIELVGDW
jgi:UDP-N-acetylmuramate dehydrogenase